MHFATGMVMLAICLFLTESAHANASEKLLNNIPNPVYSRGSEKMTNTQDISHVTDESRNAMHMTNSNPGKDNFEEVSARQGGREALTVVCNVFAQGCRGGILTSCFTCEACCAAVGLTTIAEECTNIIFSGMPGVPLPNGVCLL